MSRSESDLSKECSAWCIRLVCSFNSFSWSAIKSHIAHMYTPLVVVELMGPVTLGLGEIAGDERTLEFIGNEETRDLK